MVGAGHVHEWASLGVATSMTIGPWPHSLRNPDCGLRASKEPRDATTPLLGIGAVEPEEEGSSERVIMKADQETQTGGRPT